MKFKIHFLLLAVLLGNAIGLQAQTPQHFHCGVEEEDHDMSFSTFNAPVYSGSVDPQYLATFQPITFNIYFWIINKNDGTADFNVTYESVVENLKKANELFKPMGICFVLNGYGYINNSAIYESPTWSNILNYVQNNNYVKPNCFNVYLPKSLNEGNGVTNNGSNKLAVGQTAFLGHWELVPGNTLAHELAHTFNLGHPWNSPRSSAITDEHVTRNPNDPNYNALTAGDMVHDTPAMASFWKEAEVNNVTIYDIINVNNCTYTGTNTDALGVPFSLTPADVGNPMGNSFDPCVTNFTPGQGIRIREYIAGTPNALSVQAMRPNNTPNNTSITLSVPETNSSFVYQYSNTIITNSNYRTAVGQNIILRAGDHIFLEPNTDIMPGSFFVAEIETCDCPLIAQTSTFYAEDSVSSFENKNNSNLILYPNPANESVTITSDNVVNNVTITSMEGFVIYRNKVMNNLHEINVSNFKKGIYIVTIETVNGDIYVEKLMKN